MLKPAFTLLELMLALALFAISSVVAASFLATTAMWACTSIRMLRENSTTALALDRVVRDVMQSDFKDWDVVNNAFKIETLDARGVITMSWVGWDVVKQGLRRKQGSYDKKRHCWIKATSSIVGCALTAFKLEPCVQHDSTTIERVQIVCAHPRIVVLCNGRVV